MNNKEHKQHLVIIAGVTGSIGQELLRRYLVDKNTLVYGLSRRGVSLDQFQVLPTHNLIINVDMYSDEKIKSFVSMLPKQDFEKISYYHLLGEFKTEINQNLEIVVENDFDKDGIDDSVYKLVTHAYETMFDQLNKISIQSDIELNVVSFGSLADRHAIPCFQSFGKSREIVKKFSQEKIKVNKNLNVYLFNTSTILAADEMLERPFIFSTDVSPVYWITPFELVEKASGFISLERGFIEKDIYLANPNFSDDYFNARVTYKRRVKELYNKTI
jgi:hypothetical protein